MEYIELPDIGRIKVRTGEHIKHLSIRMAPGRGIWINIPYGIRKSTVIKFLEEKKEWILENRSTLRKYEKHTEVDVSVGTEIHTKLHTIKIEHTEHNKVDYKIADRALTLYIPGHLSTEQYEEAVKSFILNIYELECRELLPERVSRWAARHGFKYRRLTFRNNVSNWGSCSHENNISLNIKLMKLPDDLIDYVILHELCHTVEKNHSDRFWNLLEQVCPDTEEKRQKLKTYNTRI